ncbi:AMP-binding enzyme [Nocardia nova]|uniref:AMP-binding enzyme n=1 Tax=Nocardia nova TaxID=37330 RepID=UPI0021573CF6|nr:hypothetical protein [Nocardia nova]
MGLVRKGENIARVELETILAEHPAIAVVAVTGLSDQERGERVCAVIALRRRVTEPDLDGISTRPRRPNSVGGWRSLSRHLAHGR